MVYGIHGVTGKLLWVFVAGGLGYGVSLLLPQLPLIADILLRSALLTVVFTVIIYLLKLSPDFNTLLSARYHSIARLFSPGGKK
jgi:hypothetical protein